MCWVLQNVEEHIIYYVILYYFFRILRMFQLSVIRSAGVTDSSIEAHCENLAANLDVVRISAKVSVALFFVRLFLQQTLTYSMIVESVQPSLHRMC